MRKPSAPKARPSVSSKPSERAKPQAKSVDTDKPKRKVSHKGSRQKGNRAEIEFVDIMRKLGIPSQRVLASGSFVGAKADVKVGVELNADGTYPAQDESRSITRAEVKNRSNNPEYLWDYLNQDAVTSMVVLRRPKVPQGALAKSDFNQVYIVAMGLSDFAELFKRAYAKELKT